MFIVSNIEFICSLQYIIRRYGKIANKTSIYQRPNDVDVNNLRLYMAFNNKQNPYSIVRYTRPRHKNIKQFNRENQLLNYFQNIK